MNFTYIRRKRISIIWFISYLFMLLLVILLNLRTYFLLEKNLTRQNEKYSVEILNNKKQYFDNLQSSISSLTINLSMDSLIADLTKYEKEQTPEQKFSLVHASQELSAFRGMVLNVENIYIYFPNMDYIVGMKSNNSPEGFYKAYYTGNKLNYKTWYTILNEKNSGQFVVNPKVGQEDCAGDLLYVYSVLSADLERSVANIVVEISYSEIMNKSIHNEGDDSFWITDKEGKIVLSDNPEEADMVAAWIQQIPYNSRQDTVFQFKNYVALSTHSDQNDWRYIHILNKDSYMADIYTSRFVLFCMMVLCLVLGVAFALIATRHNHKPLQALIGNLTDKVNINRENFKDLDEFEYIDQLLSKVLEAPAASRTMVQDSVIRDAVLLKVMKTGDSETIHATEVLQELNIHLDREFFILAVFYIEDLSGMFFEEGNQDTEENYKLAKFIISNVLNDLLDERFACCTCEPESILMQVINTDDPYTMNEILSALEQAQDFILKNFNIEFVTCLSSQHRSLENLSLCYEEARSCMEYKFLGTKSVICYDEINKEPASSSYYFPLHKEEQMLNCLRAGDYEKALHILNEVFDANLNDSHLSLSVTKCLMYDLSGTLAKFLNDADGQRNGASFGQLEMLDRLEHCTTAFSMKEEMSKIFLEVCEAKAADGGNKMIENVQQFIRTYYDDSNLTVTMIADHFNLNTSYLSSIFKKYTQMGMLEYITKIRMERAKIILKENNYTLEKVAEMVGYTNARTFSRVFTKYVGVSPGKYRR